MRYLFLFCILLIFQVSRCQSVDFYREDLVFSIDSVYFTVNGTYYFRNTSDKQVSFPVAYPVPRVGFQEAIDTLVVYDIERPEIPVKLMHKDTMYLFQAKIDAGSSEAFVIAYRQKHDNHSAKYILTTTSYWGKPLEEASYDLLVPGYIHITGFSYPPDSSTAFREEKIYHWKKKEFMPDKDFTICFDTDN